MRWGTMYRSGSGGAPALRVELIFFEGGHGMKILVQKWVDSLFGCFSIMVLQKKEGGKTDGTWVYCQ